MKIFISQSGEKSKLAAQYLRDWLRCVIQSLEPWVSAIDIDAGDRWSVRVDQKLEATNFGILCLTRANTTAQWILFEAGALAKTTEGIHVCPYLIDLASSDIPEGPLTKFQAKGANENGTWELILAINKAMAGDALPEDQLRKSFDKWWPDLKARLETLPDEETAGKQVRPIASILEEVLATVRDLSRRSTDEQERFAINASAMLQHTFAELKRAQSLPNKVPDVEVVFPREFEEYEALTDKWEYRVEVFFENESGMFIGRLHSLGAPDLAEVKPGEPYPSMTMTSVPWLEFRAKSKDALIRSIKAVIEQFSGHMESFTKMR